jgi:hypothetical protein
MGDWRKTQYRIGPKPDHLAEGEDFKYVGLILAIVVGAVVGVALLVYGIGAFLKAL